MRRVVAIFFLAVAMAFPAVAREVVFFSPPFSLGESANDLRDIIQDATGALWFVSAEGITRWDGRTRIRYSASDTGDGAIRPGLISSITTTIDGRIWVLVGDRLQYFDPGLHLWFDAPNIPVTNRIYSIASTDGQRIWVSTEAGLFLYRALTTEFLPVPVATDDPSVSEPFTRMIEAGDGRLVAVQASGGMVRLTRSVESFTQTVVDPGSTLLSNIVWLAYDPFEGRILVSDVSGLFALADDASRLERVEVDSAEQTVWQRFFVEEDRIWLADEAGLYYAERDWQLRPAVFDFNGGEAQAITAIFRTSDGVYWVGGESGLWIGRNYKNDIISRANTAIPNELIRDIDFLSDGTLLVSTEGGLVALNRDTLATRLLIDQETFPDLPSSSFSVALVTKDYWYLGTTDAGVLRYRPDTGAITRFDIDPSRGDALHSEWITHLHEHTSGAIVITTVGGGVSILRDDTLSTPAPPSKNMDTTLAVIELPDSSVLVPTPVGFLSWEPETDTLLAVPTTLKRMGEEPFDLSVGILTWGAYQFAELNPSGTAESFLMGSYGEGVLLAEVADNGDGKQVVLSVVANEASTVFNFGTDRAGKLLVSSSAGLYTLDPVALDGLKPLSPSLSLASINPIQNAIAKDEDDTLYLATDNGIHIIDDIPTSDDPQPIQVGLSSVEADERSISLFETITDGLVLPSDNSVLRLTFFGAEYVLPSEIEYAFRLVGYADEWVSLGNDASVTLTSLPSGDYTLELAARGHAGEWHQPALSIPILVTPPIWRTWPMVILYVALGGLLVALVYWAFRVQANRYDDAQSALTRAIEAQARETEAERIRYLTVQESLQQLVTTIDRDVRSDVREWETLARLAARVKSEENRSLSLSSLIGKASLIDRAISNALSPFTADDEPRGTETPHDVIKGDDLITRLERSFTDLHELYFTPKDSRLYVVVDPLVGQRYSVSVMNIAPVIELLLIGSAVSAGPGGDVVLRITQSVGTLLVNVSESSSDSASRDSAAGYFEDAKERLLAFSGTFNRQVSPDAMGESVQIALPAEPILERQVEIVGQAYYVATNPNQVSAIANVLFRCGYRSEALDIDLTELPAADTLVFVDLEDLQGLQKAPIWTALAPSNRVCVIGDMSLHDGIPDDWHALPDPISGVQVLALLVSWDSPPSPA